MQKVVINLLPKPYRFSKEDFSTIFNSQATKRVSSRFFTLLFLKDNALVAPKLGVILAKKKQKKAVDRNYTKRIIQSFFYHNRKDYDLMRLLIISNRSIKNADRIALWKDLEALFTKVN